jgi:hypothetical protein
VKPLHRREAGESGRMEEAANNFNPYLQYDSGQSILLGTAPTDEETSTIFSDDLVTIISEMTPSDVASWLRSEN